MPPVDTSVTEEVPDALVELVQAAEPYEEIVELLESSTTDDDAVTPAASSTGLGRVPDVIREVVADARPIEPLERADGREGRVICVVNQKGGVGKTTTTVSLGAALAERGLQVLVVDLDPQGNATTGLGLRAHEGGATIYRVLVDELPVEDASEPTSIRGLHVLPSTLDLAGAEIELVSMFSREQRLRWALDGVRDLYDVVLIDCPPSLGLLTINALTAADDVIVPVQCEYFALEGLGQLLKTVELIQKQLNTGLGVCGFLLTMHDDTIELSRQVVQEVREHFGAQAFDVVIPRTVRLSEAPSHGEPITVFDPTSVGASSYFALAEEVVDRLGLTETQSGLLEDAVAQTEASTDRVPDPLTDPAFLDVGVGANGGAPDAVGSSSDAQDLTVSMVDMTDATAEAEAVDVGSKDDA